MPKGHSKRIARELHEIHEARAAGAPYACGLAIQFNDGDMFDWLCTYTCPHHYMVHGVQRVSPYSGCVIRFQITFPSDYPFKPFRLLAQRASNFFHPLINCAVATGACVPFILGSPWHCQWNPRKCVRSVLEEGLLPMWTDADCWMAATSNDHPCGVGCGSHPEHCLSPELFPDPLPRFEGGVRPFVAQSVGATEAESCPVCVAAAAARHPRLLHTLAEEAAVFSKTEIPFEITVECETRITVQVFPSFRLGHLFQAVNRALGVTRDNTRVCCHTEPAVQQRLRVAARCWSSGTITDVPGNSLQSIARFDIQPGSLLLAEGSLGRWGPYSSNGINPAAAQLLLADVQQFELLARQSWSAQRVPYSLRLIGQISTIIMRLPLPHILPRPLPLQPCASPPLPLASLCQLRAAANLQLLHVFSGWSLAAARAIMYQLPSGCMRDAAALSLCVRRRVMGGASALRLAGHSALSLRQQVCV